jgi:hypothetical protein
MPSALRDSKTLAEWIELDYFRRPRPYRRLKRSIFWATFLGAIGVMAWTVFGGKRTVYEAGPVSTAHAMFNNECERCHSESFQPLYRFVLANPHIRSVSDDTCRSCHAGPVHHGNALPQMVPDCAGCHREHRGRALLARVPDGECIACHFDLKTLDGKLAYSQHITGWNADHPAFGRWRGVPIADPGTIRFSHEAHLVPGGILDIDRMQRDKQREKARSLGGTAMNIPDRDQSHGVNAECCSEANDIENVRAPFTGLLSGGLEPFARWQAQAGSPRSPVNGAQPVAAFRLPGVSAGPKIRCAGKLRERGSANQSSLAANDHDSLSPASCPERGLENLAAHDYDSLSLAGCPERGPETDGLLADSRFARVNRGGNPMPPQQTQARNHVVLECQSCHQLDPAGRYMLPIRYEQHCQQCHPLSVQLVGEWKNEKERAIAGSFSTKPAPHPTPAEGPEAVRAALRDRLTELIQQAPGLVGTEASPAPRPVPGSRRAEPLTREQWEWTNQQLGHLERLLFDGAGGCQYCHQEATNPERRPNGLPEYRASALPNRWFPHSVFRHDSHRMLTCGECHAAASSKQSTDVLMPAIDNCRACHNSQFGARTDCAECHMYHSVEGKQQFRGTLTMDHFPGR